MEFGDMVRAGTEYFTVSQYQFKVSDESNPMNVMLLSQLLALNRCLPTALAKSRLLFSQKCSYQMFVRVLSTTLVNVTITYHVTRRIFLLRKIFHRNLNEAISTSEIVLFKFLRKIVLKKKLTITFSTFKVYSVRSIVSSLEA